MDTSNLCASARLEGGRFVANHLRPVSVLKQSQSSSPTLQTAPRISLPPLKRDCPDTTDPEPRVALSGSGRRCVNCLQAFELGRVRTE